MKVKPDVFEVGVGDLLVEFLEVLAETLLGAFLVDEVDDCAVLVVLFDVLVVLASDLEVDFVIGVDADFG